MRSEASSASSKPTTEFAQPRLSRVKGRSSPVRGYKFGCVCSYVAGHEDGGVMTGHIGTNTPKSVTPCWGRPPFDPTQTGVCKLGRGFGARSLNLLVAADKNALLSVLLSTAVAFGAPCFPISLSCLPQCPDFPRSCRAIPACDFDLIEDLISGRA